MSTDLWFTLSAWPQFLILTACIIHVSNVIHATRVVHKAMIIAKLSTAPVYLFFLREMAKVVVAQFIMFSGGFWDQLIRVINGISS